MFAQRITRSNTTNGGGGAGGSGSSHTLLPQEAKHIIKRVSTKNTKKKKNYSEVFG